MNYVVASDTPNGRRYLNKYYLEWGKLKEANHYHDKYWADRALAEVNEKLPAGFACRLVVEVP